MCKTSLSRTSLIIIGSCCCWSPNPDNSSSDSYSVLLLFPVVSATCCAGIFRFRLRANVLLVLKKASSRLTSCHSSSCSNFFDSRKRPPLEYTSHTTPRSTIQQLLLVNMMEEKLPSLHIIPLSLIPRILILSTVIQGSISRLLGYYSLKA